MNDIKCRFCDWDMMEYRGRQLMIDGWVYETYVCDNDLCEDRGTTQFVRLRPMTEGEWLEYQTDLFDAFRLFGVEPPEYQPYPFEWVQSGRMKYLQEIKRDEARQ